MDTISVKTVPESVSVLSVPDGVIFIHSMETGESISAFFSTTVDSTG